jgi:hypothetical protein
MHAAAPVDGDTMLAAAQVNKRIHMNRRLKFGSCKGA